MAGTSRGYRDRTRFSQNSLRTSYFSQSSRKNLMRGFTRMSTAKSNFSGLAAENEQECQTILCKRGFFKRLFYNRFNRVFHTSLLDNNGNCRKFAIILLILSLFNFICTVFVFVNKDPILCQKDLTSYKVNMEHQISIDPTDCRNLPDNSSIDLKNVYVYYKIEKYPFHFSSVYKMHSKLQLNGVISRNRSDLDQCGSYTRAHINGVNRVINPCGSHVVNVYNDQFTFLRPDTEEPLELNEGRDVLIKNQEYEHTHNISKDDKLKFNDYYWLAGEVMTGSIKIGLSKNLELLNGWNNENSIPRQLNSDKAGYGVKNGHFVQWMTPPPFPSFTKLYGLLQGPLSLPLKVTFNNNYDTTPFNGRKYLIVSGSKYNLGFLSTLRVLHIVFTLLPLSVGLLLLLYRPKSEGHVFNML